MKSLHRSGDTTRLEKRAPPRVSVIQCSFHFIDSETDSRGLPEREDGLPCSAHRWWPDWPLAQGISMMLRHFHLTLS